MKDKKVFILTSIIRILIAFITFTPVLVFTTRYFLTLEIVPVQYYLWMVPFMIVFVSEIKTTPKRIKNVLQIRESKKQADELLKLLMGDKKDD